MDHFELVSEYKPTGDQPEAIEQLVKGFKEGNQCQTLLGVVRGKVILQPQGKEFFTCRGKNFFTSCGKEFFT